MADGDKLIRLDDSMGVSSPEPCSPEGSPQKMISDCSDLLDLINFHSSATTQICEASRRSSSSSPSSSAPHSPEVKTKRSRSSSASSGHFDGPDSDSGSFARTNGHVESREPSQDRELIQSVSPESALESSPEDRAATVPSSVEAVSPSGSLDDSRAFGDVSPAAQEAGEGHSEESFIEQVQESVPDLEQSLVDDQGVVAIESPSTDECEPPPSPLALHDQNNLLDVHEPETDPESAVPSREENAHANDEENVGHHDSDSDEIVTETFISTTCTIVNVEEKISLKDGVEEEKTDRDIVTEEVIDETADVPPEIGTLIESDDHHIVHDAKELKDDDDRGSSDHDDSEHIIQSDDKTDVQEGEESRVVVQTVKIVEVVERTVMTTESSDLTDALDVPTESSTSMIVTEQIDTPVVGDDHEDVEDVHADSSSNSDSDTERYSSGKKFKQMKTRIISESTYPSAGGVAATTKRTTTTSETKMETSTESHTDLRNGDSTQMKSMLTFVNERPAEAEKEAVSTGVSIKDLKASFYEQKPRTEDAKPREVIDTGVDIKSLKPCSNGDVIRPHLSSNGEEEEEVVDSPHALPPRVFMRAKSYSDLTQYEEDRQREVIYTGVSVKALRTSLCDLSRKDEGKNYIHHTNVNTGVSIRSLKSSFSSSESVQKQQSQHNHQEINEIDGVKIDRNKITRNFSQVDSSLYALSDANDVTNVSDESASMCRICGKRVFHMERIKAEKGVFHKTCFRCKECSKPLSVDTYCSHEGVLYCRPHFRQLFQPKAKFEEEPIVIPIRRKHEMIIKENVPAELPPDVVRSADKPDYGLNEIPSLKNIKSRFESTDAENGHDASLVSVQVKRSESIASKMAKFQGLHSPDGEHDHGSSSSSEEDDQDDNQDVQVAKESKKSKKEKVVFSGMSELKSQWEAVSTSTKEDRARERQEELAKLRLRLCHGKGNVKAMYENACEESSGKSPTRFEQVPLNGDIRASSIKEKFEKGDVINDVENEKVERMQREKQEDLSVFEQGTANDARNLFKQMDSTVSKTTVTSTLSTSPTGNVKRSPSMRSREVMGAQSPTVVDGEIVRASDKVEDDLPASLDLSSKFKFFENYQDVQGTQERKRFTMTPPREPVKESSPDVEIARDPNIVRCCDKEEEVMVTDTTRKMLNKFRELESQAEQDEVPSGPKPLKRITPPREYTKDWESSPEPELPRDPNIVRACDKIEDDFLIEAHKAKNLKQKFERWDQDSEVERENRRNVDDDDLQPSPETAKNLKAKFEAMNEEQGGQTLERPKSKINRFI